MIWQQYGRIRRITKNYQRLPMITDDRQVCTLPSCMIVDTFVLLCKNERHCDALHGMLKTLFAIIMYFDAKKQSH